MIEIDENNKNRYFVQNNRTTDKSIRDYSYLLFIYYYTILTIKMLFLASLSGVIFFIATICIYLPIFYNCLLGFMIGGAVSYEINKGKYTTSKKVIFFLIILCLFFSYLVFYFSEYLSKFSVEISISGFLHFLWIRAGYNPFYLGFYLGPPSVSSRILTVIVSLIRLVISEDILPKLNIRLINISVWIIEFFLSLICALCYIGYFCPPQRKVQ